MPYQTGTYSNINDALFKLAAWAVANGWTQNNLSDDSAAADGPGWRLHIEKSIGGTDFFFNFRSSDGSTAMADSGGFVAGICVNGSTEYTGLGATWDKQTGFTTDGYSSAQSTCGNAAALKLSGGTYYFFATATTLSAVFESDSDALDWRMITVGAVGGFPFYSASGDNYDSYTAGFRDQRSSYLGQVSVNSQGTHGNIAIRLSDDKWYLPYAYYYLSSLRTLIPPALSTVTMTTAINGSLGWPLVQYSPDLFRGNAILSPSQIGVVQGIANEYYPIGQVEGVKLLNMKNYSNADEITIGSDTYKVFRNFNESQAGVAFLK